MHRSLMSHMNVVRHELTGKKDTCMFACVSEREIHVHPKRNVCERVKVELYSPKGLVINVTLQHYGKGSDKQTVAKTNYLPSINSDTCILLNFLHFYFDCVR